MQLLNAYNATLQCRYIYVYKLFFVKSNNKPFKSANAVNFILVAIRLRSNAYSSYVTMLNDASFIGSNRKKRENSGKGALEFPKRGVPQNVTYVRDER